MNLFGCDTLEAKREKIWRIFLERKMDMLALSEAKYESEFGSVIES